MIDDRERHEHRPAPGAHLINIHAEPFAQQDDFARNRWHIFPRKQPEQRQVKLGERIHPRHAAQSHGHRTGAQHPGIGCGHSRQFQRQIGLDRRVDLRWSSEIDVPAAVRVLQRKQMIDRLLLPSLVHRPVPMVIRDQVGRDRAVHHQFPDPVALRLLLAKQVVL